MSELCFSNHQNGFDLRQSPNLLLSKTSYRQRTSFNDFFTPLAFHLDPPFIDIYLFLFTITNLIFCFSFHFLKSLCPSPVITNVSKQWHYFLFAGLPIQQARLVTLYDFLDASVYTTMAVIVKSLTLSLSHFEYQANEVYCLDT